MTTNDFEEVPKYWKAALLVWFLALSIVIIGLSFWALKDIPSQYPARTGANFPVPPVVPATTDSTTPSAQTELYERQVTAYVRLTAAYVSAVAQTAATEPPASLRLKAYEEVVTNGLLDFVTAVLTAMFATVVGVKTLTVAKEYLARKGKEQQCRFKPDD